MPETINHNPEQIARDKIDAIFSFHRPETIAEWLRKGRSLRERLSDLPELTKQVCARLRSWLSKI